MCRFLFPYNDLTSAPQGYLSTHTAVNIAKYHRIQELEARLSGETARRQGAEEDARRSKEMERRR